MALSVVSKNGFVYLADDAGKKVATTFGRSLEKWDWAYLFAAAPDMRDLIARAIPIIENERECLADSHSVGGVLKIDPDDEGDQQAKASIDAMDAWLSDARKVVAP